MWEEMSFIGFLYDTPDKQGNLKAPIMRIGPIINNGSRSLIYGTMSTSDQ